MPIDGLQAQPKLHAAATERIRLICPCIWVVWSPSGKDLQRWQQFNAAIPFKFGRSPPIYSVSSLGFLEFHFGHHLHLFHPFHSISTNPSHRPISKAVRDIGSPESREEAEERSKRLTQDSIQSLIISFCCILYYLDIFCGISFVLDLCIFIVFLYAAMSG
jgi:hypothetical protein